MKNFRNKNMKNPVLIIAVFFLLTIGCVELDENPLDFPGPDNFYGTEAQILSALTGSMGALYSKWGNYSYGWGPFHEDASEDANLVLGTGHGNWVWRAHFGSIAILNSVIKALNEDKLGSSSSQETKDQLMAQAKFLRAFNYFSLVRLYGDVPIMTEETDIVAGEISRQPMLEVYNLILTDLQVAIGGLPEEWPGELAGRPSKDAARALAAKANLTMATAPMKDASRATQARDMALAVMNNTAHSLIPDVRDVFKIENGLGPENMFGFNSTLDDIATPPQIWLPGEMAFGWNDFGLSRQWSSDYPDQPRKAAYMILEDFDGNSFETWDSPIPAVGKYTYDTQEIMERLQSQANVPLLRFADVLLMFAEADNMVNGGPTQAAVDAVNLIINRANDGVANPDNPLTTTGMSQAEFDAAVINERRLELFFEYDRWYDLIRKEILCDVWFGDDAWIGANCDENDYLWPIPLTDLRLNDLMTQNPGYNTPGGE